MEKAFNVHTSMSYYKVTFIYLSVYFFVRVDLLAIFDFYNYNWL